MLATAAKRALDSEACTCCVMGCDCADCQECDVPSMREPVHVSVPRPQAR